LVPPIKGKWFFPEGIFWAEEPPCFSTTRGTFSWFNLSDLSDVFDFDDYRFVMNGNVVPEPSVLALVFISTTFFCSRRTKRHR